MYMCCWFLPKKSYCLEFRHQLNFHANVRQVFHHAYLLITQIQSPEQDILYSGLLGITLQYDDNDHDIDDDVNDDDDDNDDDNDYKWNIIKGIKKVPHNYKSYI